MSQFTDTIEPTLSCRNLIGGIKNIFIPSDDGGLMRIEIARDSAKFSIFRNRDESFMYLYFQIDENRINDIDFANVNLDKIFIETNLNKMFCMEYPEFQVEYTSGMQYIDFTGAEITYTSNDYYLVDKTENIN